MGSAIAILLLVLSATATFSAFGGKAWVDGDRPLRERITRRGWISLTCLLIATFAGATKVVLDAQQGERAAEQKARDRAALDSQSRAIASQRAELVAARTSLERQSQTILLTALAGNLRVIGVGLSLNFAGPGRRRASFGGVIFPDLPEVYRDLAEITIELDGPGSRSFVTVPYRATRGEDEPDEERMSASAGNGISLQRDFVNADNAMIRPASAFVEWSTQPSRMAIIRLDLVKRATTRAEIDTFNRAHSLRAVVEPDAHGFVARYDIPPGLRNRLGGGPVSMSPGSGVGLAIRQVGEERSPVSISADVGCISLPNLLPRSILIECMTRGAPRVEVGIE